MDHQITYKHILKNMLYTFGNSPEVPTEEAIDITEKIVFNQMHLLLHRLYETAEHFGSSDISHREFLFLLRHNEIKLNRLLKFLDAKDLRDSISKSISQNPVVDDNVISEGKEEKDMNESDEEMDKTEKEFLKSMRPRRRVCYEYLSQIIPEWFPSWYVREPPFDAIKQRRIVRLDMMSQRLDQNRYITFTECRRSSFRESGQQAFRTWLGELQYPFTSELAFEMLFYFANETVSELVDLALLYASNLAEARGLPVGSSELSPGLPDEPPTLLTGNLINTAFELFWVSRQPTKRILIL